MGTDTYLNGRIHFSDGNRTIEFKGVAKIITVDDRETAKGINDE